VGDIAKEEQYTTPQLDTAIKTVAINGTHMPLSTSDGWYNIYP
jgi:hypothetical protein